MQAVKGYIREYRPVMILLMDTRANSAKHIAGLCHMGYPNVSVITPPSDHPQMGGYWILWNESQIKVELKLANERIASFELTMPEQRQPVASVTSVYNFAQHHRQ